MPALARDFSVIAVDQRGIGHWLAEQAPGQMLTVLTAFLAPYLDGAAAVPDPGPHATAV